MATHVRYSERRPYQTLASDPFGTPRPMLGVRISHSGASGPSILAIVDSGADVSMFHVSVAGLLAIDLGTCVRNTVEGVGGTSDVYQCAVQLEVEGRTFDAEVQFSSAIHPTLALLGRHDVFREFQLGFDQRGLTLLIEPYS